MNILILNWRDIKNPYSGGAEILTYELAKRWIKVGNQVTWFSSAFTGGSSEEIVDGIRIIRKGHPDARHLFNSVHFLAFVAYQKNFKGKVDVIIDEMHGLPFFTPWYVKERKVALICEVAGQLWMKMFIPAFGFLGRLVELFYLRFVYKDILFVTISESTKRDLVKNGVDKNNIRVLPMGITVPKAVKKFEKEKDPTLLFLGRISSLKGIEDAILTTKIIKKTYPNIRLWAIGRGKDEIINTLKHFSLQNGVEKNVVFYGFVDEKKKFELLVRGHILISPSFKEGFGLTIPEAGFVGTPAVVYNSPGLSDVVIQGKTGLICNKNTPEELAVNIVKLFLDKKLYQKLSFGAKQASKKYNWEDTARLTLGILEDTGHE